MEQILAFILGVGAVAFVLAVVAAFKTASKVEEIEKAISEQQDWIVRNEELINRRIDQEIDRVDKMVGDIYSVIDSRFDKAENKYTTWVDYQVDILRKELKENKQLIKG
jgi:hypothetical protein